MQVRCVNNEGNTLIKVGAIYEAKRADDVGLIIDGNWYYGWRFVEVEPDYAPLAFILWACATGWRQKPDPLVPLMVPKRLLEPLSHMSWMSPSPGYLVTAIRDAAEEARANYS